MKKIILLSVFSVFAFTTLSYAQFGCTSNHKRKANIKLQNACSSEQVKDALSKGADIEHIGIALGFVQRTTSLISAVKKNCINAVDELLKNGADVNATNTENGIKKTPLMHAFQENIFDKLLEYHADVNIENNKGETILFGIIDKYFTFKRYHMPLEQLTWRINRLLEVDTLDINKRNDDNETVRMIFMENDMIEFFNKASKHPNLDLTNENSEEKKYTHNVKKEVFQKTNHTTKSIKQ